MVSACAEASLPRGEHEGVVGVVVDGTRREGLGLVEEVLVDGVSKRSEADLTGRTSRNRVVNFPGEPEAIGLLAPVRITETRSHSFRGELAGPLR